MTVISKPRLNTIAMETMITTEDSSLSERFFCEVSKTNGALLDGKGVIKKVGVNMGVFGQATNL